MSKRLVFAFVTFLVLLVSLVTVTYAWIVIAKFNYITGIDFNVSVGDGLEISLDGKNYSKSLDGDLITKSFPNLRFSDITSNDGITFSKGYSSEEPKENKNYLSFKLYFRGSQDLNIFEAIHLIDFKQNVKYEDAEETNGTFATSKGINFKSEIDFLNGPNDLVLKNEERKYYASEALRISFYNDEFQKIFDLSNNPARGFATFEDQYGAVDYYKRDNKNKELSIPNFSPMISPIYTILEDYIPNHQGSRIATLTKGFHDSYWYANVNVNIWIEGWDVDAFNAIMGDEFVIGFKFAALVDDKYYKEL